MKRLEEAHSLLGELMQLEDGQLANCPNIDRVTDEIVKKLAHLRHSLSSSQHSPSPSWNSSSCGSPAFDSSSSREGTRSIDGRMFERPHLLSPLGSLSPPPSSASSSSSEHFWSPASSAPSLEAAQAAFDSQIYASCVKIVEKMAKGREKTVDRTAAALAHHSYSRMVDDAEDEEEAAKLAQYWTEFADRCYDQHAELSTRLEMMDHRCEALEAQFAVDEYRRPRIAERRVKTAAECYMLASVVFRPFNINAIRRLQRLMISLNDTETFIADSETFREADFLYGTAVKNTWADRTRYLAETAGATATGGKGRTDREAVVAVEVLQSAQTSRFPPCMIRSPIPDDDKSLEEEAVYRL